MIDIPEEFRALGSEVRSELNVHEILEKLKILRDQIETRRLILQTHLKQIRYMKHQVEDMKEIPPPDNE